MIARNHETGLPYNQADPQFVVRYACLVLHLSSKVIPVTRMPHGRFTCNEKKSKVRESFAQQYTYRKRAQEWPSIERLLFLSSFFVFVRMCVHGVGIGVGIFFPLLLFGCRVRGWILGVCCH